MNPAFEGTEFADHEAPPPPGVRMLDHTADLGIEVEAADLPELFGRAAEGALSLVLDRRPSGTSETRTTDLTGRDLPMLLRCWLREVLRWVEDDAFVPGHMTVRIREVDDSGDETRPADGGTGPGRYRLLARVEGGSVASEPVREIKGVTLHGLAVEERPHFDPGTRWFARVVFDV